MNPERHSERHDTAIFQGPMASATRAFNGRGFWFYWWRPPLTVRSAGVCPMT